MDERRTHLSDTLHPPQFAASSSHTPMHVTSAALAQLLEISPDALVVVDHAGCIVMVNGQAEAMFGYSHEELQGQWLEVLLPKRFRKMHVAHREDYAAAPRARPMGAGLQLFGQRKDGFEFPVDISLRPVVLDNVLQVIGAIRDVTEQRRAEQERARQL